MPPKGNSSASLSDPATLANFAHNLQEGIYITNESGEILDANPAFLEIFGMSSMDEMRRYRVNDFVDENVRKREIALMERSGSLRSRELKITRLDGEVRTVLDSWYAVKESGANETLYHGILVDITGRKDLETRLREQSIRDPLTGCYNRRQLTDLCARPRSAEELWGCIYADIDHFKQYNDTYGHAAGDTVLLKMSRFLMRYVRAEEPVIRISEAVAGSWTRRRSCFLHPRLGSAQRNRNTRGNCESRRSRANRGACRAATRQVLSPDTSGRRDILI